MAYVPPELNITVTLSAQTLLPQPPLTVVLNSVSDTLNQNIISASFVSSVVSNDAALSQGRLASHITALSFLSSKVSDGTVVSQGKKPNDIATVVLERRDVYPSFIKGVILRRKGNLDTPIFASAYGFNSQSLPKPRVEFLIRDVAPIGFAISSEFGLASTYNLSQHVSVKGFDATVFGNQDIRNKNQRLTLNGFVATYYGRPLVYNLKQFLGAYGYDQSLYGYPYLIGGVKYLAPSGFNPTVFGEPYLVKYLEPKGIDSLVMPAPTVSPRIVYAVGIASPLIAMPDVRDPAVKPNSIASSTYGTPTIWYHTRLLSPTGILSYQSGYPRVADPTQFTYPLSLDTSAVFGDVAIRNTSFRISPQSIYDSSFSDYATATNSNRYLAPSGINSLSIGAAVINNETPSVFVQGIANYDVGTPAVGYAIRYVQPTGFDHLLLGRPTVIKAPELLVRGFEDSRFANPTVWYKNRVVDINQKGINSFKAGEQTVWYGQRPVKPKSWQSSSYGKPVLTHEVREVIGQGFVRDSYGTAWVSRGTRIIEPTAIYKEFASNHYVGGVQTIAPQGYIATLWGERIIPDNQKLYPLGFSGLWGNTTVDLLTKYIEPVGFISVGQQPQDRWGDTVAYNLRQYIVQEFDINSGLVPPKWSDWTAIANRNITMIVTGFISQKFGYSQIDNNATPLLPTGIAPPPITIKMISHGARTVLPEAIEPPPLSSWGVVHNAGRVISPSGIDSANYGNDSTVINTRREYHNIGRIDSLETGTPMIAYRIRTIDIEPRYSIAPPQIDLPTVDLWTRYIDCVGWDMSAHGLPSLSIHFNTIAPKWYYRDKLGTPALRNVTPELLINGHNSDEYGDTHIRTQWREIKAQGDAATLFGSAMIADTKQVIEVRGLASSRFGQKATVTQTGSNGYIVQRIQLNNIIDNNENGFGISSDDEFKGGRIPSPTVSQNIIYVSGVTTLAFGSPSVHSNNIVIDSGIAIDGVSKGLTVRGTNNPITVIGIPRLKENVGNPRLSPHTIYAVKEAPAQAIANHKPPELHYVNSSSGTRKAGEVFGNATVESTIRDIKPTGFHRDYIGTPTLYLGRQVVQPESFRVSRFGLPSIPFTLQIIELYEDDGISEYNWGDAVVSRPYSAGTQYIGTRGISSFSSTGTRIENQNRRVYTKGADGLKMGMSKSGDTPYMWQGLRVGEFVPMSIGAGDTSLFGETIIGLRVREIALDGFVAFRSEYELSAFDERMRVTRGFVDDGLQQEITAVGAYAGVIGLANVRLGQHFIRPDGNSDQFRKSGYSAEFGAPIISN